ncbi:MAG: UDP-N-acetylmuramoyl-tripeptide--D-alanyl-D-alanine ligase [Elusimicrobiota bacterium]|jgi:UDP-N-acetylmuramoyl-tripeptide--D-alanyl-D-alanine ligase|nr:UDP-N-acetylmuramoyl-tripeptide--D-alanyl-D-alanine ligase [Elusimicrobiota bacterium]
MQDFFIKDLVNAAKANLISGSSDLPIQNISIDSRTIKEGDFFFAIKGENFDGHNFIPQAIEAGAAGIVVSKPINISKNIAIIEVSDTIIALGEAAKAYRNSFKNLKVAAITGSNGKTTTKEILFSILNRKYKTLANKGNFNNRIGAPLSIFELDSSYKYAVLEIGSSLFGEIDILANILAPDAAAITNIGCSHLETFQTPAGVFKEKKNIFKYLAKDGFIALNTDDEYLNTFRHCRLNGCQAHNDRLIDSNDGHSEFKKVIDFSIQNKASIYADNIKINKDGVSFILYIGSDSIPINSTQKGETFIKNALCAAAIASGFGFSINDIKIGIENFTPPRMRMEITTLKSGAVIINDAYNANPSSMQESIKTICATYADKDIILILGDMLELGVDSSKYHKELGEFISKQKVKASYLAGKDMSNTAQALKGGNVFYAPTAQDLLENLKTLSITSNTVILVKGSRGMKMEIMIGMINKDI